MNNVEYSVNDSWIRRVKCPKCSTEIFAWQSSGMSESFPHFYCDKCSNVILRDSDKPKVRDEVSEKVLSEIESTLPSCECGGQFRAGANPKCPVCRFEFKHQNDSVKRLIDPHMIIFDNAVLCDEKGPKYRVIIKK